MNYEHLGEICDPEVQNVLEHHGILGMRWGVRRWQPYPKGTRKGKFLGLDRDADIRVGKKPKDYTKGAHGEVLGVSRDQDIRIKKGSAAYRLQEGSTLKPGQSYVSFDKLDHLRYISSTSAGEFGLDYKLMYDSEGRAKSGSAKSLTLRLSNDVIAPSYEKTMDAFIDTMGKSKLSDIFAEPVTPAQKQEQKEFLKDLKKLSVDECRDRAYINFSKTLMKDTAARKRFFESLEKQGYNAIIDENDYNFGKGMTSSPFIVFNNNSLKVDKVTSIDKEDIEYFSELYWGGETSSRHNKTKKKWEKF